MTLSTKHIDVDVPDCPTPAAPNFHGVPTWVLGWGMGLSFVLLIGLGFLLYALYEKHSDNKAEIKVALATAATEVSKSWTTCPTCKADFHPKFDAESLAGYGP